MAENLTPTPQINNTPTDERGQSQNVYNTNYYTGAHVAIFFGPVLIDDIVSIVWSTSGGNLPLYSYNKDQYAMVLPGKYLVQGTITMYDTGPEKIQQILAQIKRLTSGETGRSVNSVTDLVYRQINKYMARFEDSDLTPRKRQKLLKYLQTISNRSLEIERIQSEPFDISIVFGNYMSGNFKIDTFNDISIVGSQGTVDVGPDLILETYNFIGRRKKVPYNPPELTIQGAELPDGLLINALETGTKEAFNRMELYPNLETYIDDIEELRVNSTVDRIAITGIPSLNTLLFGHYLQFKELSFIVSYDKKLMKPPTVVKATFDDPLTTSVTKQIEIFKHNNINLVNNGVLVSLPDPNIDYMIALAPIAYRGNEAFADFVLPTGVDVNTWNYTQDQTKNYTKGIGYSSVVHKHLKGLVYNNNGGENDKLNADNYDVIDMISKPRQGYALINERKLNPHLYRDVEYQSDDIGGVEHISGEAKKYLKLPDINNEEGIVSGTKLSYMGTETNHAVKPKDIVGNEYRKEIREEYKSMVKTNTIVKCQRIEYLINAVTGSSNQGKLKTDGIVGDLNVTSDVNKSYIGPKEIEASFTGAKNSGAVSVRLAVFPVSHITLDMDVESDPYTAYMSYLMFQDKYDKKKTICPDAIDSKPWELEDDLIRNERVFCASEYKINNITYGVNGYSGKIKAKYMLKSLVEEKDVRMLGPIYTPTTYGGGTFSQLSAARLNPMEALARYVRLEFMKYLSWCWSVETPHDNIPYYKKFEKLSDIPRTLSENISEGTQAISDEFLYQYAYGRGDSYWNNRWTYDGIYRYEKVQLDVFLIVETIGDFEYVNISKKPSVAGAQSRTYPDLHSNSRGLPANPNTVPYSRNYFYLQTMDIDWTGNPPQIKVIDPKIATYIDGYEVRVNTNLLATYLAGIINPEYKERLNKALSNTVTLTTGRANNNRPIVTRIKKILDSELEKKKSRDLSITKTSSYYKLEGVTVYPSPFKVKNIFLGAYDSQLPSIPGYEE